jgi:hypothetical protein
LSRQHLALTLISTNDVPDYLAALAQIPAQSHTPIATNELGAVLISRTDDPDAFDIFIQSPANVDIIGVYDTPALTTTNSWSLLANVIRTGNPTHFRLVSGDDQRLVLLANHVLDSDGDGIPDAIEELLTGTSPHESDSDGDGISDWDEIYLYMTNPNMADTSGDGIPDGVKIALNLDPHAQHPVVDIHDLATINARMATFDVTRWGFGGFELGSTNRYARLAHTHSDGWYYDIRIDPDDGFVAEYEGQREGIFAQTTYEWTTVRSGTFPGIVAHEEQWELFDDNGTIYAGSFSETSGCTTVAGGPFSTNDLPYVVSDDLLVFSNPGYPTFEYALSEPISDAHFMNRARNMFEQILGASGLHPLGSSSFGYRERGATFCVAPAWAPHNVTSDPEYGNEWIGLSHFYSSAYSGEPGWWKYNPIALMGHDVLAAENYLDTPYYGNRLTAMDYRPELHNWTPPAGLASNAVLRMATVQWFQAADTNQAPVVHHIAEHFAAVPTSPGDVIFTSRSCPATGGAGPHHGRSTPPCFPRRSRCGQ